MKKLSILALAALALTACDNFELPEPKAPVNEQEAPFTVGDFSVTPAAPIVMTAETPADNIITIGTYTVENWPADYDMAVRVQASDAADFSGNVVDMDQVTATEGNLQATAEHIIYVTKQLYGGKGEIERTLYVRYQLVAEQGGVTSYIVGDPTYYYGPTTVKVTLAPVAYEYAMLYTPGPANEWKPTMSMPLYADADYTSWTGYAAVKEMVKFTVDDAWSIDWGMGAEAGKLMEKGANIELADGLYYFDVKLGDETYTATQITAISLIGDALAADDGTWSVDVDLKPTDNFGIWTGEVEFKEAGGWKFRMNHGWDLNLGGTTDNLVANGDNNACPGAGKWVVTLNLTTHPYSYSVTAAAAK